MTDKGLVRIIGKCDGRRKLVFKMCRQAQADESNMAFPEGVVVNATTPKSQSQKVTLQAYGVLVRPVKGRSKRAAKVVPQFALIRKLHKWNQLSD